MKKYIIFLLALFALQAGYTQQQLSLSLQQAKELALKNRFDTKANSYDTQMALKEITRKKQAFVPDVRITGNVSYHPQIQAVLVPPGFVGTSEPTLLALGANSISVFNLELNQPILNVGIRTDIALAKNAAQWEIEKNRAKEIEIKQRVSEAYLNVLLRELQKHIAANEEQRYAQYYELAKGKYEHGALIENDYLRAQLDHENAKQQAIIGAQQYDISLGNLYYELNIDSTVTISLTDRLESDNAIDPVTDNVSQAGNRTELRQLEFERIDNELQIKKQRQSVLPTLSFAANYAQQYQNIGFNFSYTESQWWSPFSSMGLKLTIPLTGHVTNKTAMSQLRLKSDQNKARLLQQQANISHEISQSIANLSNARINAKRTKEGYLLSQKIYSNQQQQLAFGAFSYDALLNTEASMTNAEQNYITATYDLLLARLKYEKATGQL